MQALFAFIKENGGPIEIGWDDAGKLQYRATGDYQAWCDRELSNYADLYPFTAEECERYHCGPWGGEPGRIVDEAAERKRLARVKKQMDRRIQKRAAQKAGE
jgi:hypothetical protein